MSDRALPGEGDLPLGALVAAAARNSLGISAEVEVFSEELRSRTADGVAARVAAWRSGTSMQET